MDKEKDQNSSPMESSSFAQNCQEVIDRRSPVRQASDDIPLEFIGNTSETRVKNDKQSKRNCSQHEEGDSKESLLAKHLLLVHASHCEGCQFMSNHGHDKNADDTKSQKKDDGCGVHGCGSQGCGLNGCASPKTEYQQRYTKAASLRNQARCKPIPAPISVPPDSTQTTPNNTFDYRNNSSSTPRSATNSQHMCSFDSSDPGQDDCQRMINTPPPAVLHHDWKTEVIFPQQSDCNNKWAAGVTVFMALALFLGIIAFMVVFFATRGNVSDRIEPIIYESMSISAVLKVNLTYKEEYGDLSSQEYRQLSTDITHMLDNIFLSSELKDVYLRTTVNGFRPGSVYIDTIVLLSSLPEAPDNDEYSEATLKEWTKKLVHDIIHFGVKNHATMLYLHAKLEALYVTNVVLDITRPLIGTTDRSKGGTTMKPTDDLFVDVRYHELLNQAECGTRRRASARFRIIGGHTAPSGNWPWIGSLDYAVVGHKCAASLIAPEWAVTAAHCLILGRDAILQNITFGDTSLDSPSPHHQEVPVARIYSHPGFSMLHRDHDIAVLKLAEPVKISTRHVRPVCLETEDGLWGQYRSCYIAGWGVKEAGCKKSSNISNELQEASIPLVTKAECSTEYLREGLPSVSTITDNMICAGTHDGSIDSCQSDSGGPLVCQRDDAKWYLVGVTSFGYSCGHPDFSGVYARVSRYWDFIKSVIDGEPSLPCEAIHLDECKSVLPYSHTYVTSQKDFSVVIGRLLDNSTNTGQYNGTITFEDYRLFMCSVFLPRCQDNMQSSRDVTIASHTVPCQGFCHNVEEFVETNNLPWSYIFYDCLSFPLAENTSTRLCESKEDSFACGKDRNISPFLYNHKLLQSPNFPDVYNHSLDCSWFVTTPSNTNVLIKFQSFEMPECCDVLSIGNGIDVHDRMSVKRRLRGNSQIQPLVVHSNRIWLRLQKDGSLETKERFSIEFHAISTTDSADVCGGGMFRHLSGPLNYPSWWRCDGVIDCDTAEDELNCNATTTNAPSPIL